MDLVPRRRRHRGPRPAGSGTGTQARDPIPVCRGRRVAGAARQDWPWAPFHVCRGRRVVGRHAGLAVGSKLSTLGHTHPVPAHARRQASVPGHIRGVAAGQRAGRLAPSWASRWRAGNPFWALIAVCVPLSVGVLSVRRTPVWMRLSASPGRLPICAPLEGIDGFLTLPSLLLLPSGSWPSLLPPSCRADGLDFQELAVPDDVCSVRNASICGPMAQSRAVL